MIYITTLDNIPNLPYSIEPILITTQLPLSYKGLRYFHLTPTYNMWLTNTYEGFKDGVLDKLDIKIVIKELNELSYPNEFALVSDSEEHIDLVYEWFINNGYKVEEFI